MCKLINTTEAAEFLGCDVKWIRRAIDCKLIKGWRFGVKYKTTPECIKTFIDQFEGEDILNVIRRAYESKRMGDLQS